MNIRQLFTIVIFVALLMVNTSPSYAQLGDFFKNAQKKLSGNKLSTDKITRGLKEALNIGTGKAVEAASQEDGYFKNPDIRIPLPSKVTNVEKNVTNAEKMKAIITAVTASKHADFVSKVNGKMKHIADCGTASKKTTEETAVNIAAKTDEVTTKMSVDQILESEKPLKGFVACLEDAKAP